MSGLFDETVFNQLGAEIGEADTLEVLKAFLADTESKMAGLANSEVRPLIKREAHSIKSSAATFGFGDLSRLARELESGAETITSARLQDAISELQQTFEMTRQFAKTRFIDEELTI
jgi:hypothetical protein